VSTTDADLPLALCPSHAEETARVVRVEEGQELRAQRTGSCLVMLGEC
jgi:hypothetical protein